MFFIFCLFVCLFDVFFLCVPVVAGGFDEFTKVFLRLPCVFFSVY